MSAGGSRALGLLAVLALACGCSPARSTVGLPEGAYVLPDAVGGQLLMQCSRATPEKGVGSFQPDPADIAALEAVLAQAIAHRDSYPPNIGGRAVPMPGTPDLLQAPKGFKRQYAGIVRSGRRYIYGNYFPANDFTGDGHGDLASNPVVVCDGGPAFFGAEYDVAAKRFTHLAFNGPG